MTMTASDVSHFPWKIGKSGSLQKIRTASLVICTIAAASFAAPMTSDAATYFALLGNFENPPTGSPGTGTATVVIDEVAFRMDVSANFAGLFGTTTAAHIHCCIASPGNVVVASQTPTFAGFPLGVTSGSFSNSFDMKLASSYNAAFITANGGTAASAFAALLEGLDAGQAYFNIHTSAFGGGEIRGFLQETPIPAALPLFASILAGGGLITWRRKRKAASATRGGGFGAHR
jgi:CHRD domain